MKNKSTISSSLAILILCVWTASASAPSARPVESIDAKLLLPGYGTYPVEFKPGTVRLRMSFDDLDLDLAELQSVRYRSSSLAAGDADTPPDQCTVATVAGDILVGRCPYREFRRLLKATGPALPKDDAEPVAITFPNHAPVLRTIPEPIAPLWSIKLANGSLVHARPVSVTLRFEDTNGAFSLPVALVSSIARDTGTDLLDIRLTDAPYTLQSYRPRGSFAATADSDRSLDFPWSEIVSLSPVSATSSSALPPAKRSQQATATFRAPDGTANTLSLPDGFPVTVLSLDGPAGTFIIPSTRIVRIARNPDRTRTVITAAGDILTGKLSLPDIAADPADPSTKLDSADAIDFKDHAKLSIPSGALVWRLASGDILVATRKVSDSAAAAKSGLSAPVPNTGRISAVRSSSAVATSPLPQPDSDGTWSEKRYTLLPLATSVPFDLPSKLLDTVRFPPVAALPPATIPAGPSAFVSDEIVFPGGVFSLGRSHGEGQADETPAVTIQIASFALANTPVTVAQFRAFVADTGYVTTAERMSDPATWKTPGYAQTDDDPVVCVSWIDAVNYCNWRSKRARLTPAYTLRDGGYHAVLDPDANGYRLPIEAEWEYAARNCGRDILFPWGTTAIDDESTASSRANFTPVEIPIDPWPNTCPVKAFPADPSGLYGMAGNVWEWCQDMYNPTAYVSAYRVGDIMPLLNPNPRDCPNGIVSRVIRGGSFRNPLPLLRCNARARGFDQQIGRPHVGMRLARNAD